MRVRNEQAAEQVVKMGIIPPSERVLTACEDGVFGRIDASMYLQDNSLTPTKDVRDVTLVVRFDENGVILNLIRAILI